MGCLSVVQVTALLMSEPLKYFYKLRNLYTKMYYSPIFERMKLLPVSFIGKVQNLLGYAIHPIVITIFSHS